MRNYKWYQSKKKRVRRKYTFLLGWYLSPKELKEVIEWHKKYEKR